MPSIRADSSEVGMTNPLSYFNYLIYSTLVSNVNGSVVEDFLLKKNKNNFPLATSQAGSAHKYIF